jgi:hypothetical protein
MRQFLVLPLLRFRIGVRRRELISSVPGRKNAHVVFPMPGDASGVAGGEIEGVDLVEGIAGSRSL